MTNAWITAGGRMCILSDISFKGFPPYNVKLLWDQLINRTSGSSSEPMGDGRLLSCHPGKWKPLRHFTVKPASFAHITFQFSYINWDVLGTLCWLHDSNTLVQKQKRTPQKKKHTVLRHTKSMTSFSLSVGEKEDILFVKLINTRSFRQLFLYALYHIPRCHNTRTRTPSHLVANSAA